MQKLDEINIDDCYQNYMYFWPILVKLIYSEKSEDQKFCEIFPLPLTVCNVVKSKGKVLQNFVVFSEYRNFK